MTTRPTISNEDFIRVVIVERDQFPTEQAASDALGYASVLTFRQRLKKMQEDAPVIFQGVQEYSTQRKLTNESALDILQALVTENEPSEDENAEGE